VLRRHARAMVEPRANNCCSLQNISFSPMALDEKGNAFGFYSRGQEQGIAEFRARFTVIDTLPATSGGVQWMSYRKPWLVWAQSDSLYRLGIWSVHAWNSTTGEKVQLGNSQLPDGTYLDNQLTFPVVGHGYVAWSTPTSRTSADIRVYRFNTHETLTLDSGRVSSPVIAGQNLVWAKFTTTDQSDASFRMVDAETFKPVAVPAGLATPQSIVYLAGSRDYLAWTSWIFGTSPKGPPIATSSLTVERLADGTLTRYQLPDGDVFHTFQFPILAGHFLVWFTGTQNTVLDLQTGKGFDVNLPSSIVGNDDAILLARVSGGGKTGGALSTSDSSIQLSSELAINSCTP
jgi:hypothetical protein